MLLLLALSLPSSAATLDVCPNGCAYNTLPSAVAAASANDTILLGLGSYDTSKVVIDKPLTITGAGSLLTQLSNTIDPAVNGAVAYIFEVSADLTLENITLKGDPTVGAPKDRSGILVTANVQLTVRNSVFTELDGDWGSAVSALGNSITRVGPDVVLESNSFLDCGDATGGSRTTNGGAIFQTGGTLWIDNNVFRRNTAENGGAIFALGLTSTTLQHNDFEANYASGSAPAGLGGSAYILSSDLVLWDNLLCNSSARHGGGLFADGITNADIYNNIFAENSASFGGGLYWYSTNKPLVHNNTFAGNAAGVIGGGSGALFDGSLMQFDNNIVTGSGSSGTGISATNYSLGEVVHIEYSEFYSNGGGHLGSDLAAHSFSTTNLIDVNPELIFWGRDGSCYVDAFYSSAFSPAINNGDPAVLDVGTSVSDIGAYGGPGASVIDADGDTWEDVYDCDEADATIFPGALEICDGRDNDCDGDVDEGFQTTWWRDSDGDSLGDLNVTTTNCSPPAGYVDNADDCDDSDPLLLTVRDWWLDQDGDGLGDMADVVNQCAPPSGYVDNADDCDDTTQLIQGVINFYRDADVDNFGNTNDILTACIGSPPAGYVINDQDCDDSKPGVFPGADEKCSNGIDDDCDTLVDGDDPSAVDFIAFYADADADGYADPLTTTLACDPPSGYITWDTITTPDCDDTDSTRHPGAEPTPSDVADSIDRDCDGKEECYLDADGDGFGFDADANADGHYEGIVPDANDDFNCTSAESLTVLAGDCNDIGFNPASQYPGATIDPLIDIDDGLDRDCDGFDECFEDLDGDGFGSSVVIADDGDGSCTATGESANQDDCDDSSDAVQPAATEVCDTLDNNCDGLTDDPSASDALTWYADNDGDGFGGIDAEVDLSCETERDGFSSFNTDCDDTNAGVFPDNIELCNDLDDDCNGTVDDDYAEDVVKWYVDADGDSFGTGAATESCKPPADGYSNLTGDCDDADKEIGVCAADCGGCASASQRPGQYGLLFLLALGGVLTRRRSQGLPARVAQR